MTVFGNKSSKEIQSEMNSFPNIVVQDLYKPFERQFIYRMEKRSSFETDIVDGKRGMVH